MAGLLMFVDTASKIVAARAVGAKKEEIDGIPTSLVPAAGRGPTCEARCSICLADYEAGESLRQPKCGHSFHKDCLDTWLTSKAVCPICQQNCR